MGRTTRFAVTAAMLGLSVAPAAAQVAAGADGQVPRRQAPQQPVPPARLGFGADNDAQPGGVSGNAPFNNQLRKFTDPLGANGSK